MYNPSWVLFIIIVEVAYSYIGVRVGGFKGPFFVTDDIRPTGLVVHIGSMFIVEAR